MGEQNPLADIGWFQEQYSELIDQADFTEDLQLLVAEFGLETALRMIKMFEGSQVYFKSLDSVIRPVRDKVIRKRFDDGADYKDLAREFRLTVNHVRKIIDEA